MFALQAFVILGGVVRVIPLTGVTLPFISYGGSSIVANMVLLGLLLVISDRARRPPRPAAPRVSSSRRSARMNAPIVRLYVLVLALFVTVVGFTSYWAIFDADELRERPDNRRSLIEAQKVPRGTITSVGRHRDRRQRARRGRETRRSSRASTRRGRCSATRSATASSSSASSEIERSENDILIGRENEFASIIEQLEGQVEEGSDLTVTLDAQAQQIAQDGLENAISIPGTGGALVAIEPDTGAVRAMVSEPGYDPNLVPDQFKQLNREGGGEPLSTAPRSRPIRRARR